MEKIQARKTLITFAWSLRKLRYSFDEFKDLIETEYAKSNTLSDKEIYDAYWELQDEMEHIQHWVWDHTHYRKRSLF